MQTNRFIRYYISDGTSKDFDFSHPLDTAMTNITVKVYEYNSEYVLLNEVKLKNNAYTITERDTDNIQVSFKKPPDIKFKFCVTLERK